MIARQLQRAVPILLQGRVHLSSTELILTAEELQAARATEVERGHAAGPQLANTGFFCGGASRR
jgi:hypothetical protein